MSPLHRHTFDHFGIVIRGKCDGDPSSVRVASSAIAFEYATREAISSEKPLCRNHRR